MAKPAYRNTETGKCLFGVLSNKNGTWSHPMTARDGSGSVFDKGRIDSIDGLTSLGVWETGSHCDDITTLREPSLTPPMRTESGRPLNSLSILVALMCRSVRFEAQPETVGFSELAQAVKMVPSNSTFHQSGTNEGKKESQKNYNHAT